MKFLEIELNRERTQGRLIKQWRRLEILLIFLFSSYYKYKVEAGAGWRENCWKHFTNFLVKLCELPSYTNNTSQTGAFLFSTKGRKGHNKN